MRPDNADDLCIATMLANLIKQCLLTSRECRSLFRGCWLQRLLLNSRSRHCLRCRQLGGCCQCRSIGSRSRQGRPR